MVGGQNYHYKKWLNRRNILNYIIKKFIWKNSKILIIGGGGYIGTILTNKLLELGYHVTVYDLFIYGNFLKKFKTKYPNLDIITNDIRNLEALDNSIMNKKLFITLFVF